MPIFIVNDIALVIDCDITYGIAYAISFCNDSAFKVKLILHCVKAPCARGGLFTPRGHQISV